jgi:hypothetical protein
MALERFWSAPAVVVCLPLARNLICDGLDAACFPRMPDSADPDARLHLIEASENLMEGTEYEHGSDSRKRTVKKSTHTGCGVVRRSKAYSAHAHSRTINCHCACPTAMYRL